MMAQSEMVQAVMEGLKQTESGGDYNKQQRIRTADGVDYKVGAYGILLSKWPAMAAAAGYPDARWQDRTAQDVVVGRRIDYDFQRFGAAYPDMQDDLPMMASISFKYGAGLVTEMVDNGITTPDQMKGIKGLEPVIEYVGGLSTGDLIQQSPSLKKQKDEKPKNLTRAEDRIRQTLVAMRDSDRERGVSDGSDEEIIENGNQELPATAE